MKNKRKRLAVRFANQVKKQARLVQRLSRAAKKFADQRLKRLTKLRSNLGKPAAQLAKNLKKRLRSLRTKIAGLNQAIIRVERKIARLETQNDHVAAQTQQAASTVEKQIEIREVKSAADVQQASAKELDREADAARMQHLRELEIQNIEKEATDQWQTDLAFRAEMRKLKVDEDNEKKSDKAAWKAKQAEKQQREAGIRAAKHALWLKKALLRAKRRMEAAKRLLRQGTILRQHRLID